MKITRKILAIFCLSALSANAGEVLIFSGGMKGHKPFEAAEWMKTELEKKGHVVTSVETMDCLNDAEALKKYDLIIPNWTLGKIAPNQLDNLIAAVENGSGLAGLHGGMGDAFRKTPKYEALVGGQFLKHPYIGKYTVNLVDSKHPIFNGTSEDFEYQSEKYFMRLAKDITVLADTDYDTIEPGLRMPIVWTREQGNGRVFYSALGHNVKREYVKFPEAATIFLNGCDWAIRKK